MRRFQRGVRRGPEQVDGDVAAAIARRRDAPEDQRAEQHLADVVAVGDLPGEELAQHDREEDVERDDADEGRGAPLDRIDDAIHRRCAAARGAARSAIAVALDGSEPGLVLRDASPCSDSITAFGVVAGLGRRRRPTAASVGATALRHASSCSARELVRLVAGMPGELGAAGELEVGPGRGDLLGPFGRAVVVDRPSSAPPTSTSYLSLFIAQTKGVV